MFPSSWLVSLFHWISLSLQYFWILFLPITIIFTHFLAQLQVWQQHVWKNIEEWREEFPWVEVTLSGLGCKICRAGGVKGTWGMFRACRRVSCLRMFVPTFLFLTVCHWLFQCGWLSLFIPSILSRPGFSGSGPTTVVGTARVNAAASRCHCEAIWGYCGFGSWEAGFLD